MKETGSRNLPFLTNDTAQPNKNKRRQTSSNATLIIRFYRLLRGGRTAHNALVAPYPWCVAGLENGPSRTEQAGAVNWLTNCTFLSSVHLRSQTMFPLRL